MFRFLHQTEDIMDTELTNADGHRILTPRPHRHDPSAVSEKLKLLELEFADLMALSLAGAERRDRSGGVWVSTKPFSLDSDRGRQRPFLCWLAASKKSREAGKMSGSG